MLPWQCLGLACYHDAHGTQLGEIVFRQAAEEFSLPLRDEGCLDGSVVAVEAVDDGANEGVVGITALAHQFHEEGVFLHGGVEADA